MTAKPPPQLLLAELVEGRTALAIRSTVGKHRNLRVMLVRHREVVDRFGAKQQIWRLVAEERPERSHGSTASSLASVAE